MIENGKFVQVDYTGTLEDGAVFDTSEGRAPLEFQIGGGMVIPAFEDAVKEMAIGDEKDIFIKSADAYGDYNDQLTQQVPAADIKQHIEPEIGKTIYVQLQNGQNAPATIKEVTEENVTLDFNHPMAGKDLNFHLKLVEINDSAQQKHEHPHGESCSSDDCKDGSCGGSCS